ncbi:unnamed protein product, partial [marine sediment metagenome]
SIYYDTPRLNCFYEKADGDFIKTKVRLRWYEDCGTGCNTAFLEVKRKAGGSRRKNRIKLMLDHRWLMQTDLSDQGFVDLLQEHADIGELPPCGLAPVVDIRYRRYRFICPATMVGVSLDTLIAVDRVNSLLIPGTSCENICPVVIEVKGERGRDDIPWIERLYGAGFRSRSFSKYGECMSRLVGDEES